MGISDAQLTLGVIIGGAASVLMLRLDYLGK
jgi:hypothetical protein